MKASLKASNFKFYIKLVKRQKFNSIIIKDLKQYLKNKNIQIRDIDKDNCSSSINFNFKNLSDFNIIIIGLPLLNSILILII